MGANQSPGHTRTVTMDNPIGVIDVSDAVVQRLKSGMTNKESLKHAAAEPSPSSLSSSKQSVPSSFANPMPYPPPAVIYAEPNISALEVRRQKEAELEQNDLYWRKRMAQLEQTFNKTNAIMEKEYSVAVEDVRKRFQSAPPSHQLPPCQDLKVQLIACYHANPGESLKCTEEATAFINCVSENRVKKLDTELPAAADLKDKTKKTK